MTNLPLDGLRILIVEDEYYLATDARRVIEQAGGEETPAAAECRAALK